MRPIPSFADNQAGFAPKPEYRDLPDELSSRDLWDAFNRAWRDGTGRADMLGGGGTFFTIRCNGVTIDAYKPSGREGSVYGLVIRTSDMFTIEHFFELENGVRVTWEKGVSVRQVRGILR